jgi:hypothetical protein
MFFFVAIKDKPKFGVGCRSPPFNLNYQKNSDWRKGKWLLIKVKKNENGGSGKKPRKTK